MANGGAMAEFGVKATANVDKSSFNKAEQEAKKLSNNMKKLLGMIGITVSAAGIISFGKQAARMAAEVENTKKRVKAAFSEIDESGRRTSEASADRINAWAKNMANVLGKSEEDLRNYALEFAELGNELGFTKKAVSGFSAEMTRVALNIAAFNGLTDAEAISAFRGALEGSDSAAKKLNVSLDKTRIQETMLKMGIKGTFEALDEATKVQVRYNTILDQSQGALEGIGAAAQALEDGDYAAWQENLTAKTRDFKALLGTYLLPYITEAAKLGVKILDVLKGSVERSGDLTDHVSRAKSVFSGVEKFINFVVDTGKKVIDAVGGTDNVMELLLVTLGAIAAVKAADTISGIAGAIKNLGDKGAGVILPFLLLYAVLDDIFGFARGEDSLIGRAVKAAGGNVEAFQKNVQDAITKIEELANTAAEALGFEPIFNITTDENGETHGDLSNAGQAKAFGLLAAGGLITKTAIGVGKKAYGLGKLLGLFGGASAGAGGAAAGAAGASGGFLSAIPWLMVAMAALWGGHKIIKKGKENGGVVNYVTPGVDEEGNVVDSSQLDKDIEEAVGGFFETVVETLEPVGEEIVRVCGDMWEDTKKQFGSLFGPAKNPQYSPDTPSSVSEKSPDVAVSSDGYNLLGSIQDHVDAASEVVGSVSEYVSGPMKEGVNAACEAAVDTVNSVSDAVNSISEFVSGPMQDSVDAFTDAVGRFAEWVDSTLPNTNAGVINSGATTSNSVGWTFDSEAANNALASFTANANSIAAMAETGELQTILQELYRMTPRGRAEIEAVVEPTVPIDVSIRNTFQIPDKDTAMSASRTIFNTNNFKQLAHMVAFK